MKKFIWLSLLISLQLFSAGKYEVQTHQEVHEFLMKNNLLGEKTLIVYDIDNTLLKSNHLLGSDQWFNWQNSELANNSPEAMTHQFDELLEIQHHLFNLGKMNLVEESLKSYITLYKNLKMPMIALTSRGPELQYVTFRELDRNDLNFNGSKIGTDLIPEFSIANSAQKLLYHRGVFMTSGAHKGQMLNFLLDKFGTKFKHVIFIDDHQKHTDRVFESLQTKGIDISTFRYAHEDKRVQEFNQSDKAEVKELAEQLVGFRKVLRELLSE